ncbi:MAG TPA: hypothetical protein VFT22_31480, partial [Kofleriaceae bacterium]|nr:hypothetical protein [Kofleriaceae bacterium]
DGGASVVAAADVAPSMAVLEHLGGDLLIDGPGAAAGQLDAPLLTEVGGSLRFGAALQAEVSLPAVRKVDGDIETIRDSGVTRIELPGLTQLAGALRIAGSALTQLSIPSEHTIGGNLFIDSAVALTDLELGTTRVGGEMSVAKAPKLVRLSMPHLASVHGDDRFPPAIQLTELGVQELEFPALQQTDGFSLERSDGVTAVRLPSLTAARILRFEFNPALESVSAPEITSVEDLLVENLDAKIGAGTVHSLDFGKLTTVTDALEIRGARLSDLSGFRNLESVLLLRLVNVDLLPDFRGLASIRQVSSLQLALLPALISLDGLEPLTALPIALDLDGNDALISIAALRHVTRIGALDLEGNHALADLALPSATEITGDLTIDDMAALQDLTGLAAVRSVTGELMFLGDPGLSEDEIAAFRHQIGR